MSTKTTVKNHPTLAIGGATSVRATLLPYGRQSISDQDIDAVVKILKSDWHTQGPNIEDFEKVVAQSQGMKHAMAVNSGAATFHAAYFGAGIEAGDEIVMPAMLFAATADAALYLGAKPVFADIEPDTGNISVESAKKCLTKKTKAIVKVDFSGQPCSMTGLRALADEVGIPSNVDGAHSLGAKFDSKQSPTLADMTTLSFHPVKLITTGEGGMILTNNDEFARMFRFRTHGIEKNKAKFTNEDQGTWYHEMQDLGFNYRITDFQAALGTSQMRDLASFVARRREIAASYRKQLGALKSFECLVERPNMQSAYHLFQILVTKAPYAETRKFVFKALHVENIGVQVHYIPIYQHPYYQQHVAVDARLNCSESETFYSRIMSLPMFRP